MGIPYIIPIYFCYGLAFFSMGLLVAIEGGRSSDERLRKALRPLAGFGLVHAANEWLDMFGLFNQALGYPQHPFIKAIGLAALAFSFLSLAAFGSFLLSNSKSAQRVSLLIPLGLEAIWVFGILVFRSRYAPATMWDIADVWTRYTLGIPSAGLAAIGLIAQQRAFRRSGLVRFGQDSLWAAISFGWYALIGQIFTSPSPLPPSTFLNYTLFQNLFGFPIQLLRALLAAAAAFFVIRFMRAFQVETDRKILELQEARLQEAKQREAMRGELYRRVVAAQEAERKRIARDLHDETGQALTAIGLGLRALATNLNASHNKKQALTNLHRLEIMTNESLEELQRLITDLRPSHLDDLGLPAAIRWYAGRIQERFGLNIKVETSGPNTQVAPTIKITLFRIVQEALNNIIKHAEAQKVYILLDCEAEQIRVSVRDDGHGFDMEAVAMERSRRPSLGLAGMQERAALLGGTVVISSRLGQGTLIEASIPYANAESEENNEDSSAIGG
jgi:signal transduction histidine kinase